MTHRTAGAIFLGGSLTLAACGGAQKAAETPAPTVPASAPASAPSAKKETKPVDPWAGAELLRPPAPASAEPLALDNVTRTTLPNGMELILVPRHDLPVVDYELAVKSGSFDDPLDKRGLAVFTASMLRKGTKTKTADQISQTIESVGAELGGAAGRESSTVYCRSLTKDAGLCLATLADVVQHPTFPAKEMDEVRQQEIAGVKQVKDAPLRLAGEFFANALYGDDDPRGRPPTVEGLDSITQQDLVGFYDHRYAPNASILAVAGDFDPKTVTRQIAAAFAGWKKQAVPERKMVDPTPPHGIHVELIDKPDLTQTGVVLGTVGVAHGDPDYYATEVMNYILGGGVFSSRLMKVVRSKNGDTYGVSSHFNAPAYKGDFAVSTKTRVEKTIETLADIRKVMQDLRDEGPTEAEVAAAKGNLAGSYPVRMQGPSDVAEALLDAEIEHLPADYVAQYPVRIGAVTLDDVKAAAKAHLDPDDLYVVLTADAHKLAPMLADAHLEFEKIGYEQPVSRAEREEAKRAVTPAEAALGKKVLAAAIAAAGGQQALQALKDITFKGTLSLSAGPQTMNGTATVYQTMAGAVRQEMQFGPVSMTLVVGPAGAFMQQMEQRKVFQGGELAAAQAEARFASLGVLVHAFDPGVVLRGLPAKDGDDVVELDPPGGSPITFYFDGKTHLLAKYSMVQEGEEASTVLADYRPEAGVQIAHKQTIDAGGATIDITFDTVAANTGLKPDLFAVPEK